MYFDVLAALTDTPSREPHVPVVVTVIPVTTHNNRINQWTYIDKTHLFSGSYSTDCFQSVSSEHGALVVTLAI